MSSEEIGRLVSLGKYEGDNRVEYPGALTTFGSVKSTAYFTSMCGGRYLRKFSLSVSFCVSINNILR